MTWFAVCFDVDCTITVNDSLDLLAEFMGKKEEVQAITNQARVVGLITAASQADVAAFLQRAAKLG